MFPNPPPRTRYAALQEFLATAGHPAYRLRQILRAVHERGSTEFADLSELPKPLREALLEEFGPSVLALRPIASEHGEQVEKVLFESRQGARIETVFARYRTGWTSLCISTQVGCGLGCTFCATGAVGLLRNLTADEICDQVLYFRGPRQEEVDSIAFMGMGEALANPHTFPALEMLTHKELHGLSPRRITVSTVGFAPGMRRLVDEHPQVNVTLSVHSPYDEERRSLIPLQQRFPLADCLEILDTHVARARRKVYLAYLLIDELNDTEDHARALAELVTQLRRPGLFHVSVIPYNDAVGVNPAYRRPPPARVRSFIAALRSSGVHATRRQQFGGNVDAACGQLHARYLSTAPSPQAAPP
ncbi:radical SAM protein [Actinopolymorpha alba]|uniref:radical SAM protein n=1 Tax=Actinopolymorpha alba TaxID=533267 RepID=UPI0005913701|nr:radical SAM protein [Actinopolymorpha alba]